MTNSCTKTHRHGQDVVLVKQQSPMSPITVLENHLHVNHAPPSYHATGGHHGEKCLTKMQLNMALATNV